MDSNGKIMLCLIKFTGVVATVLRVYLIDIYLSVSATLWCDAFHTLSSQLAAPLAAHTPTRHHIRADENGTESLSITHYYFPVAT